MVELCDTPDLGRIKAVGVFLLDDCMAPIYGPSAGYITDCPAGIETSDNVDDGEPFTRRCSDGRIKRHIPGKKSLESIEANADFHWLTPEWVAQAGGASPIIFGGEVVGWADGTRDSLNVLLVVWQEILGGDVCGGEDADCNDYVRMYPLKGARLTEDGDIGGEDGVFRLTGETVDTSVLGSGPLPLFCDPETGEAAWATDCFPSGQHRYKFIGAAHPEECGAIDTVEPDDPCTPAS